MQAAARYIEPVIKITQLTKTFAARKALDSVSFEVQPGEMVALIGASGSGKSTLLRNIAGLALGDGQSGSIEVLGQPVQTCGCLARNVRQVRARLGFVFQQFNLVGRLPVMTNVLVGLLGHLPQWRGLTGLFTRAERQMAMQALARVGIAEVAWQRASTLSGGQQQRAAIARTLVQKAQIILADEPIASLDPESARRVMDTLSSINTEDRTTVVVSLHQVDFAIRYCPRTIAMKLGRIVYDGPSAALTPQLLRDLYGTEAPGLLDAGPREVMGSATFVTRPPNEPGMAAAVI
jgi:phosphonate transport system ATP-binding protein